MLFLIVARVGLISARARALLRLYNLHLYDSQIRKMGLSSQVSVLKQLGTLVLLKVVILLIILISYSASYSVVYLGMRKYIKRDHARFKFALKMIILKS